MILSIPVLVVTFSVEIFYNSLNYFYALSNDAVILFPIEEPGSTFYKAAYNSFILYSYPTSFVEISIVILPIFSSPFYTYKKKEPLSYT